VPALFIKKEYDVVSDWTNDGNSSTAGIRYNLEKESTITEETLRLNGFRTVYAQIIPSLV